MSPNAALIQDFCNVWPSMDLEKIMGFFADDAVYTNIPIDPPNAGKEAIRKTIEGFLGMATKIEFVVHHATENDAGVVMNERTDRFLIVNEDGSEKWAEAPVMGIFEVENGKITAWRDYFDMGMFMKAMG